MKIIIANSKLVFQKTMPYFSTIATEEVNVVGQETRAFVGALNNKTGWFRVVKSDADALYSENEANTAYFRDQNKPSNSQLIGISKTFFANNVSVNDTRVNIMVSEPGIYRIDYLENIDAIPLSRVKTEYIRASHTAVGLNLGQPYNLSHPISRSRKIVVKDNSYLKCYDALGNLQNTVSLQPNVVIDLSSTDYDNYEFFRVQSSNDNPIIRID